MKRVLSLLLSVAMLLSMTTGLNLTAVANEIPADGTCGDSLSWNYNADNYTLTISGDGEMDNYSAKTGAPWNAFSGDIETVIVENGVTSIGDYAFFKSSYIYDVQLADTVTSIGKHAFDYCESLEEIDLPQQLTIIKDNAFSNTWLFEVVIPANVETISYEAFAGATYLESLRFEDGSKCREIGESAFYQCGTLETFTIPASVETLSEDAFYECTSMQNIYVEEGNQNYASVYGVLYSKDMKTLIQYPDAKEGRFVIPESVETIGFAAFDDCLYVDEIVIPSTVKVIEDCAFWYSSLTSITIESGVTSIGNDAFNNCQGLTDIIIPDSVTSIGEYAFTACKGLKTIYIPKSVTNIGTGIFDKCKTSSLVVFTEAGSAIEEYCRERNIAVNVNAGQITLNLDPNGGTIDTTTATVTYNEPYGELPVPQRNGYAFAGWYTAESGGTKITADSIVRVAVEQTLYAHWTGAPVNVTFDANGGVCDTSSKIVYFTSTYGTLPVPSKTGYSAEWTLDGTVITSSSRVRVTENHTLIAQWTANKYSVEYYNGSTKLSTYTATYDKEHIVKSEITKNGYVFLGWSRTNGASSPDYLAGEKVINLAEKGTVALYAVWQAYPSITAGTRETVNLDKDGSIQYYSFVPSETGTYVFSSSGRIGNEGFICDESMKVIAKDNGLSEGTNFTVVCKMTVGTQYYLGVKSKSSVQSGSIIVGIESKAGCTVKFDANGGISDLPSMQVAYGYKYGNLPYANHTGANFEGWYTQKVGGVKVDANTIVDKTSDHTLYAHYTGTSYKVYYYVGVPGNLKSIDSSTHVFGVASPLKTAEELGILNYKPGYHFAGWSKTCNSGIIQYTDGQKITDLSSSGGAVGLYAVFEKNSSTIFYVDNGVVVGSSEYLVSGSNSLTTAKKLNLSKPGYVFAGWSTDYKATTVEYQDGEVLTKRPSESGNVNLYAVWQPITYIVNLYNESDLVESMTLYYNYTSFIPTAESLGLVNDDEEFLGWSLTPGSNEVAYADNAGLYNLTDEHGAVINLYAISGRVVETRTVTLDANGGQCSAESKIVEYGKKLGELPVPVLEDGEFAGWYDAKTKGVQVNENTIINDDITLYAYWYSADYPLNVETTKTHYQIGEKFDESTLKISFLTISSIPANICNVTVPDMTTPGKKTVMVAFESNGYIVKGSVDIYVVSPDQCAVNFNGGSLSNDNFTLSYNIGDKYGEMPVPDAIPNENYNLTFAGWYDAENAGKPVSADDIVSDGITLYAYWYCDNLHLDITDARGEYLIGDELETGTLTVTTEGVTVSDCEIEYCVFDWPGTETAGTKTVNVTYVANGFVISGSFDIVVVDEYTMPCIHESTHTDNATKPTCTETGYSGDVVCDNCGEIVLEGKVLSAKGHGYDAEITRPTCTEKGYTTYKCVVCEDTYIANFTEPMGHSNTDAVTEATCTSVGYTTHTCKVCGFVSTDNYTEKLPHKYDKVVTEPTCTSIGYTTFNCENCDDSYIDDYTDMADHNFTAVITEPTCTTEGYTAFTCTVCGEVVIDNYVEKLEHDYEDVVTEATCTQYGYTTHTCKSCGDVYIDDYVDETPHFFSANTEAPTCTEHGYTTYTCGKCGYRYISDYTSATGHEYETEVTEPTCSSQGYTTYTCMECGDSYVSDYTGPIEHDYIIVPTAATCTEGGYTTYTCADCRYQYVGDITPPKGHSYETQTTVTKATASSNGKIVKTDVCKECGSKKASTTTTIYRVSTIKVNAPSYVYTGRDIGPGVTVKNSQGVALKYKTDYTLTYAPGRTNVGTYTIIVNFMGNYSGTKTLSFDIIPKSTTISSLTAQSQAFTVKWNLQKVQTTGYQLQYSQYSNFTNSRTLNYANTSTSSVTRNYMGANKRYYVRVRTYKTVNGKTYYSAWSTVKTVTTNK